MMPLVSYRLLLRKIEGPLPEQDLIRAHTAAPDVLKSLQSADQHFWLSQGLQSLLASGVALAGYLVLEWSMLWILAALALDVMSSALGDWIKLRLAPGGVAAEMSRALETQFVVDTSTALNKAARWTGLPGPPRRHDQPVVPPPPIRGIPPLRFIYSGTDVRQHPLGAYREILLQISWFAAVFSAFVLLLLLHPKTVLEPVTLLLLGFTASGRITDSLRRSRAADCEPWLPHPHLLPNSLSACAAFCLSGMTMMLIILFANSVLGVRWSDLLGSTTELALLGLHVLSSAGILWLWHARVRRCTITVERFLEVSMDQHRARWRRVNAEDDRLCLPGGNRASPLP